MAIKIGFLPVTIWDVLDIVIVGVLAYQLYRLLRGSIGLNIFVGLALLYLVSQLVNQLGMLMLSRLLNAFMSLGFIMLVVIFQPEIRRFLLLIGNSTLRQRNSVWDRLLGRDPRHDDHSPQAREIYRAMQSLSKRKTGALIVLAQDGDLSQIANGGTMLHADVSSVLLQSIFQKESPLHDGAVIIQNGRIERAGAVLPLSDSSELPESLGLRHRAAVGLSEQLDAVCLLVSEETGKMSLTRNGKLEAGLGKTRLKEVLGEYV